MTSVWPPRLFDETLDLPVVTDKLSRHDARRIHGEMTSCTSAPFWPSARPARPSTWPLAGPEIMNLGEPVRALPEPIPARDVVDNHSYAPPPPGPAPTTEHERIEAERRAEEMAMIAQLNYDPEDPEAPAPECQDGRTFRRERSFAAETGLMSGRAA